MRNGKSDREGLLVCGVHRWRLVYTRRASGSDEGLQWDNLD